MELVVHNPAKPRYHDNDKTIWFKEEFCAENWLIVALQKSRICNQYKTVYNGKSIRYDLVILEGLDDPEQTLKVLELKPGVITKELIVDKITSNYIHAIPMAFPNQLDYELNFIGAAIEAEAEFFLEELAAKGLMYPTPDGELKIVSTNFYTYQDFLNSYYYSNSLSNDQAKNLRKLYKRLSSHDEPMPFLGYTGD